MHSGQTATATAASIRSAWAASLNAAAERRPVLFHRGDEGFAILPVTLLREVLQCAVASPEVIAEGDGWTVLLPGYPVAADGTTFDEAVHDFVSALRDYADAWNEQLYQSPNHRHAAALIQLVAASDDEALLAWVRGPLLLDRWRHLPHLNPDRLRDDIDDLLDP